MNKPVDTARGARGGYWIWRCPETGLTIRHSNYPGLRRDVKIYLRANSYPIGSGFDEQFDENVCANAQHGMCENFIPPTLLEKMGSLAKALYQAGKNWRQPLVTPEELQRRRDICMDCSYYGGSTSLLKVACTRCGCGGLKAALIDSHCPLPEPRW